jgi:hypothetical protein
VGILSFRRPRTRLGHRAHSSSPWENLTRKQRRSSVIKTNSARALHQSTSSPKPLCLGN